MTLLNIFEEVTLKTGKSLEEILEEIGLTKEELDLRMKYEEDEQEIANTLSYTYDIDEYYSDSVEEKKLLTETFYELAIIPIFKGNSLCIQEKSMEFRKHLESVLNRDLKVSYSFGKIRLEQFPLKRTVSMVYLLDELICSLEKNNWSLPNNIPSKEELIIYFKNIINIYLIPGSAYKYKVIGHDNLDRDNVSEILVAENFKYKSIAEDLCKMLNKEESDYFYSTIPQYRELYEWEP